MVLLSLLQDCFFPVFKARNIKSLNIPVAITPEKIGIHLTRFLASKVDIIIVSPIAFGRGGKPILAHARINHKVGVSANIAFVPRLTNNFRVLDRSYNVFAIQNRADETSPCAIMITSPPARAHWDSVLIPAIINLMCETEE